MQPEVGVYVQVQEYLKAFLEEKKHNFMLIMYTNPKLFILWVLLLTV